MTLLLETMFYDVEYMNTDYFICITVDREIKTEVDIREEKIAKTNIF